MAQETVQRGKEWKRTTGGRKVGADIVGGGNYKGKQDLHCHPRRSGPQIL